MTAPAEVARAATAAWLREWITGLGLCPFAGPALARGQVRTVVSEADELEGRLQDLARELQHLLEEDVPHRTTLLVLPEVDLPLEDFLHLAGLADALLEALGLVGRVQLVAFHPEQRFADGEPGDAAAFATRAPFPTLHLLLEEDVAEAIAEHPDPDGISADNSARLRHLGPALLARQLRSWQEGGP